MNEEVIKTGVDDLLELLKGVRKIAVSDAAEKLGVSVVLVQSWIDFLVEEDIVGIEYKFTKPLIYLNKEPIKAGLPRSEAEFSIQDYKDEFWKRAAAKQIPEQKISFFWKNHVKEIIDSKKEFFYREARNRKLNDVDSIWNDYSNAVLNS